MAGTRGGAAPTAAGTRQLTEPCPSRVQEALGSNLGFGVVQGSA